MATGEITIMNVKTIAFANQKGGVGKTTCCVNLAAVIADTNKRVLLIDLDPQGNATTGSGFNKNEANFTSGDVLQGKVTLPSAIVKAHCFDLLPSNMDVTEAEINVLTQSNKQKQLDLAIKSVLNNYDWIFIDCPPSLNILTLNALIAADSVIIPMQCEYYALEGISSLITTIEDININFRKNNLYIEGIVRTMYDPRNKLCKDVSMELLKHFGKSVYETVIPRNIRVAEAPSCGLPVVTYDKTSAGAKAYIKLGKELLKNNLQPKTLINQPKELTTKQLITNKQKEKA